MTIAFERIDYATDDLEGAAHRVSSPSTYTAKVYSGVPLT